jgi:hypothetical protein
MKLATLRYANGAWSRPFPDLDSERTLVLAFAAPRFGEKPRPLIELASAYPRARVIGCSSAGEIDQTRIHDDSIVVSVVRFEHTRVKLAEATLARGARAAGEAIARDLAAADLKAVFVLAPGTGVDGSALAAGLNAALASSVIVTGGLASDGDRFHRTWVIAGGRVEPDAVVAVGLYGDRVRIGHGSRGGWDTFGVERVVTRAEGNVLYTLDDRPALALYKDYLGDRAAGLPATALRFPLALRPTTDTADTVVRTVVGVDEARQALTFAAEIPQGWYAKLMSANLDRLVLGAQQAGAAAARTAEGPVLCVAVSCVGRRLMLGERSEEELQATLEALPVGTAQVGFYAYAEIAPHTSGEAGLHNQTMSLTVVSEHA